MLDGGARFTVACKYCVMWLVVDRIRLAEATVMAEHLRTQHAELRLGATTTLDDVLDHYCVSPAVSSRRP